jgi:threonylcarbamoyladenosine tRNA methylthiotransferase MtaB
VRVYLATFGCRANQYDSEAVRAMLTADGHEIVASPETAQAAVFNSCAVTAEAEADLRQQVRRAARANPTLRTVVMGCAAALDRGAIRALPTVEHVLGGADLPRVAAAFGVHPSLSIRGAATQTGSRALLRIQDGCDEHCTFCATTLARGANRSRKPAEILDEATRLAEGHPEIVLTGVHIGTYGADIGSSLGALVERLLRDVPRARFRLSSVEATEVDDPLLELLTAADGLAPYLHAPLQSGSDRLLKRMGRHWYTASRYAAAVQRIVGDATVFGLGGDVIAGFPGETQDDHAATLSLIEALPFTSLHVFPYSVRPGTPAERLPGRIRGDVIARRAAELRAAATQKAERYRRSRVGGTADVVVIGGGGDRAGLTEDYLSVALTAPAPPRGSRFDARLELADNTLLARPRAD